MPYGHVYITMKDHSEPEQENHVGGPAEALEAFMGGFGKMDVYAQIVLEEFMEALLDKKE